MVARLLWNVSVRGLSCHIILIAKSQFFCLHLFGVVNAVWHHGRSKSPSGVWLIPRLFWTIINALSYRSWNLAAASSLNTELCAINFILFVDVVFGYSWQTSHLPVFMCSDFRCRQHDFTLIIDKLLVYFFPEVTLRFQGHAIWLFQGWPLLILSLWESISNHAKVSWASDGGE